MAAAIALVASPGAGVEEPPAAMTRAPVASDEVPEAAAGLLAAWGLEARSSRRLAPDLYLIEGEARGENVLCVLDAKQGFAGGCNPKRSFWAGRDIVWGISENNDPSNPIALRIHGLVKPAIKAVQVHFGGIVLATPVTQDGSFFVEATSETLEHGRPALAEGLDARGQVISSAQLPQG
jgi:hypothetical protein